MRTSLPIAAIFVVLILIVGSGSLSPANAIFIDSVQARGNASGPVWPPPPAQARIKYLASLSPESLRTRPSVLSRVVGVLAGRSSSQPAMSQPYGVAIGPDGKIYVADTVGGTIHVYDIERRRYSTLTVDGAGSLIGIAFSSGRMFVTDSASGRLLCLDMKGHTIWARGPKDGFERPTGIAAGTDRVFVVDTTKNQVVTVLPDGTVAGRFGTRGDAPGAFNYPTNVVHTPDGRLFVTDTMNFRVQIFDEAGALLGAFGHLGDGSGDFTKPKGIGVDSAGHVYVVEGLNDVVQIFDEKGTLLLAFGGTGSGDGQFWLPTGIAIVNDIVYVADAANHRVQMFEYVKDR